MSTDKDETGHNYLMVYDLVVTRPPERVLEIGVWRGGSCDEWRRRWPGAEIHGIDTGSPESYGGETGDYTMHVADAYDPDVLDQDWVLDGFDLIVDDGPHTIESQVYAARHWAPLVRPGGVFVIEDIPDEDRSIELGRELPEYLRRRAFVALTDGISSNWRGEDPTERWSRMLVALA